MRVLISTAGLQLYALALAFAQSANGVRTDEAKYLMDIPYPHPPLARWLLGLFDGFAWQEIGARIVLATVLVQAAWIVWEMGRSLRLPERLAACAVWLLSASFVLQVGTVMMAPLTAFQTLLFLWILSLPRERVPAAATIGFLWLVTLFTALQGALLLPLCVAALRLRGERWSSVLWYAGAPLALVALYVLGNPLIPASALLLGGSSQSLPERTGEFLRIVVLAGSGVGSLVGTVGLLLKRKWLLTASFALVAAYVFVGPHEYYAILLLPFFITGCKSIFRRWRWIGVPTGVLTVACTVLLLAFHVPYFTSPSPARDILGRVESGVILVRGSMGHEWQYEARPGQDVRAYDERFLPEADAVVCFSDCDDLEDEWASLSSVQGLWLPKER